MPAFKEMDPELVTKLLEGYENELGPATTKLEAFYRQFKCPKCSGHMNKHFISVQHAFGDEELPIPRSGLKCLTCDLIVDPHSGILLGLGTAAAEVAQKVAVGYKEEG